MSTTTAQTLYVSNHGHPLLWQEPLDVPVVTVENYEKWYSLYVLFPDGRVETVPGETILDVDSGGNCLWIDHCFHPRLLLLVAKHYGGCSHPTALEAAKQ